MYLMGETLPGREVGHDHRSEQGRPRGRGPGSGQRVLDRDDGIRPRPRRPVRQERWLEVGSPDRAVNMVLELRGEGTHGQAEVPEHLPTSNVMFRCDDLPATHRELAARGVEFPQPPVQQPFGWWSMFNDTEGNRFALEQTVPEAS